MAATAASHSRPTSTCSAKSGAMTIGLRPHHGGDALRAASSLMCGAGSHCVSSGTGNADHPVEPAHRGRQDDISAHRGEGYKSGSEHKRWPVSSDGSRPLGTSRSPPGTSRSPPTPTSPLSPYSPVSPGGGRRSHKTPLASCGAAVLTASPPTESVTADSSTPAGSKEVPQTPPENPAPPGSQERGRKVRPAKINTKMDAVQIRSHNQKDIQRLGQEVKIFDLYCWDKVLQEDGDGGKVVVCQRKKSDDTHEYVLKMRSKASLQETGMEEIFRKAQQRMLNFPPHDGVVPLYEVLESDEFYYVVMEKATGGPLFYSLVSEFGDGVMPASAIRRLMAQILEAVGHIHVQGMLHRDIKPDNLVMQVFPDPSSPTGKANKVALIDFDHADPDWSPIFPTIQHGETVFGTLRFNAPETFLGSFTQESDLYSVGVILYLLMTGKMPYDDDMIYQPMEASVRGRSPSPSTPQSPFSALRKQRRSSWKTQVFSLMQEAPIDWSCQCWQDQPMCLDFCQRLLAFDPGSRFPDASTALEHPWFQDAAEYLSVSAE